VEADQQLGDMSHEANGKLGRRAAANAPRPNEANGKLGRRAAANAPRPNEANGKLGRRAALIAPETKRTVITIGMVTPPHENGRGPGGAELA
jgi:hypothetical protein